MFTSNQEADMALTRCTCIYRSTEPDEVIGAGPAVTVALRDPQCPAANLHERAARARAAAKPVGER
ncbi:hypothetical protein [uncultured Jatrophihabitans sp.]|uniref:hypothetical protein n=1 Tax=uncultured Jatrophihabitans sp. TaxID=1610747 RepID=UPI0035CBFB42